MVDLSHAGNLGRVQTLFSGSFSVGVAISAFVFGGIIERFGYRVAFTTAAGCVGLGMLAALARAGTRRGGGRRRPRDGRWRRVADGVASTIPLVIGGLGLRVRALGCHGCARVSSLDRRTPRRALAASAALDRGGRRARRASRGEDLLDARQRRDRGARQRRIRGARTRPAQRQCQDQGWNNQRPKDRPPYEFVFELLAPTVLREVGVVTAGETTRRAPPARGEDRRHRRVGERSRCRLHCRSARSRSARTGAATLPVADAEPVRWLRFTVRANHGNAEWTYLAEVSAFGDQAPVRRRRRPIHRRLGEQLRADRARADAASQLAGCYRGGTLVGSVERRCRARRLAGSARARRCTAPRSSSSTPGRTSKACSIGCRAAPAGAGRRRPRRRRRPTAARRRPRRTRSPPRSPRAGASSSTASTSTSTRTCCSRAPSRCCASSPRRSAAADARSRRRRGAHRRRRRGRLQPRSLAAARRGGGRLARCSRHRAATACRRSVAARPSPSPTTPPPTAALSTVASRSRSVIAASEGG